MSEDQKKKISESLKGHIVSGETGLKISKAKKGYHPVTEWKKGNAPSTKGKSPWNKGKHILKTTKKKISQSMTGKHLTKEHKQNLKIAMQNPRYRELQRQKRLHQIFPTKDTSIELKLQDELSRRGIAYCKHYPIIGQPDLAFPDKKIAVFADGNYWHNLSNQKEKDARINEQLRNDGWTVLRFWEHEINSNVEGVVDEIEDVLCNNGGDQNA